MSQIFLAAITPLLMAEFRVFWPPPMPDNDIGTLGEKSLHAAVKRWYARPGDRLEVHLDGYVIDIVRGDHLIEIQTRNFTALKRKLAYLTGSHPVRLIYPVARKKWIVRLEDDGRTERTRRKSPKKGRVEDVFRELVRFPGLVLHPNFTLEVLLVHAEQVLINDGRGSWRRKGWSIHDHRLLEVVEAVTLATPADFRALLPPSLPESFTVKDLAGTLNLRANLAQKMAYCLRHMGAIEQTGKRGRSYLYRQML